MNITLGNHYQDNDDNIYRCIAFRQSGDYAEVVMELVGDNYGTLFYSVFYRSNWAWLDRENPDYRIVEEVDYYPSVVKN